MKEANQAESTMHKRKKENKIPLFVRLCDLCNHQSAEHDSTKKNKILEKASNAQKK